ncbi:cytochrome P450 4F22 [Biomphalaria glabrata]|nr:cytochrome P450 4F22 [Biomphalaria glabrata]
MYRMAQVLLKEYVRIALIILLIVWTVTSLSRTCSYREIAVHSVSTTGILMLSPSQSNVSLHQCAALCDRHENCSTLVYLKSNKSCTFYGLDYPRSPFPRNTTPASTGIAFTLTSACKYTYSKFFNKCFLLLNTLTTKVSHSNNCSNLGGKLIQLNTLTELQFLRELFYFLNGNASAAYYVGAELQTLGQRYFIWTNTTRNLTGSPMWGASQPDGLPGPNENCVETTQQFGYLLNDVSCSMNRSSICEFSV